MKRHFRHIWLLIGILLLSSCEKGGNTDLEKLVEVNITPEITNGKVDVEYTFTAKSGYRVKDYAYVWDFGDGTPSVTQNQENTVTHKYATSGRFPVSAILRNKAGKEIARGQAEAFIEDKEDFVISNARFDSGIGIGCGNNLSGYGIRGSIKIKKDYLKYGGVNIETFRILNSEETPLYPHHYTSFGVLFRKPPVRSDGVYNYYENVDLGANSCQSNNLKGYSFRVRLSISQVPSSSELLVVFP